MILGSVSGFASVSRPRNLEGPSQARERPHRVERCSPNGWPNRGIDGFPLRDAVKSGHLDRSAYAPSGSSCLRYGQALTGLENSLTRADPRWDVRGLDRIWFRWQG